jgi:hypothetical protein
MLGYNKSRKEKEEKMDHYVVFSPKAGGMITIVPSDFDNGLQDTDVVFGPGGGKWGNQSWTNGTYGKWGNQSWINGTYGKWGNQSWINGTYGKWGNQSWINGTYGKWGNQSWTNGK